MMWVILKLSNMLILISHHCFKIRTIHQKMVQKITFQLQLKNELKLLKFCPKIQLWFSRKFRFFWVKNSWKCCGFGLFSCWQFWFHEKNCQKIFWVKNSWKCLSKLNFWTKIWLFEFDEFFYWKKNSKFLLWFFVY